MEFRNTYLEQGTDMSKRALLLLGLTGVAVGVIAAELARGLFRSRIEQSLRDPREKRTLPEPPLPHHAPARKAEDEPWVTPLPEQASRTTH